MKISCVIASGGNLPTNKDINDLNRGNYWVFEKDYYDIYPSANDYKAFVKEKTENSITLEFYRRNDGLNRFNKLITELIHNRFRFETKIIN